MTKRNQIVPKGHRICVGCGEKFTITKLKQMDGNECCPGEKFSRDKTQA